jgi:hypothetical protein
VPPVARLGSETESEQTAQPRNTKQHTRGEQIFTFTKLKLSMERKSSSIKKLQSYNQHDA